MSPNLFLLRSNSTYDCIMFKCVMNLGQATAIHDNNNKINNQNNDNIYIYYIHINIIYILFNNGIAPGYIGSLMTSLRALQRNRFLHGKCWRAIITHEFLFSQSDLRQVTAINDNNKMNNQNNDNIYIIKRWQCGENVLVCKSSLLHLRNIAKIR